MKSTFTPYLVALLWLPLFSSAKSNHEQYLSERQPTPYLGNGYYQNPILVGTHGDTTVCRKGEDFYMTHTNRGTNKLLIWHSRDLVNWEPLDYALKLPVGKVWAIDLDYYEPDDTFYLYMPVILGDDGENIRFTNMAMKAKDPAGPWEGPFDLGFGRIDPGHVADDDGNRYVYVDKGYYHQISKDGISCDDPDGTFVYDGWPIPENWVYECHCLESPKFFKRGDYYYLISAQGGTGGPATSHMAVIARSKSPTGPWVNSPFNPLVRTRTQNEHWWRQGHGDIVDDIEGNWWMMYTAYDNGYENFRKVNLLLPIEWTEDDWPIVPEGAYVEGVLKKPAGEVVPHGLPLSDTFENDEIGTQWHWFEDGFDSKRYNLRDGKLSMKASGDTIENCSKLVAHPTNHAYEIVAKIKISGDVEAGIFVGERSFSAPVGVGIRPEESFVFGKRYQRTSVERKQSQVWVKIRNYHHDISYYVSENGEDWKPFVKAARKDQNDEIFGIFALGEGTAVFESFYYQGIE